MGVSNCSLLIKCTCIAYIRVPLSALVLRKMEEEAGINQRHARQGVRVRGGREGGRDGGREGERGRGRGRGQTGRREWMPNESPVELDYICQQ